MPTYQGTAILLGYTIYRNDTQGGWDTIGFVYSNGSGSMMDTFVVPGVTYSYVVLAENNYGEADALSNVASAAATSANLPPSEPLNLQAHPGVGYVLLTWDAPASSGSSAITRYDVYRSTTPGGEGASPIGNSAAGTLEFNDTTGTPGTTYYYVVKAVNGQGSSPVSNEVSGSSTAPPSAPSAPQNLESAAHNGYVILTWDAPASEGSSPITGYNVYRGASAGSLGSTPIGNTLPGTRTFNDSTVTNGVTYYYGVRAVNAAGTGPVSNVMPATPSAPGVAPTAPTNPSATGMTGSILVEWDPPSNYPGVPVTYYLVYRGTTAGGEASTPISNQTGTTFTDSGVVVGTPYYYKIRAGNQFGQSGNSAEVFAMATSQAANTPAAPTGVHSVVSPGQVVLNWTAPSDTGGSPITGYKVFRTVNGSAATMVANLTASTTSYTDHVGAGEYTYWVVATNANGNGATSAVAEVQGQAASPSGGTTDYTPYIIVVVIVVIILIILGVVLMRRRK
jgi:titin